MASFITREPTLPGCWAKCFPLYWDTGWVGWGGMAVPSQSEEQSRATMASVFMAVVLNISARIDRLFSQDGRTLSIPSQRSWHAWLHPLTSSFVWNGFDGDLMKKGFNNSVGAWTVRSEQPFILVLARLMLEHSGFSGNETADRSWEDGHLHVHCKWYMGRQVEESLGFILQITVYTSM